MTFFRGAESGWEKNNNEDYELTSPRRINLTRRNTSRGGLTLVEVLNLIEFISLVDCCIEKRWGFADGKMAIEEKYLIFISYR